jgi:hypothetical protein
MAIEQIPTFAKIAEARLHIAAEADGMASALTRKGYYAVGPREMWRGSFLFAAVSKQNAAALRAFLESRDGPVEAFLVPLKRGFATNAIVDGAVNLAAPAAAGSRTLRLNTVALPAGTLLALGTPTAARYQVVELLDDVPASYDVAVSVAPAIRWAYSQGLACAYGDVLGAYVLAKDDSGRAVLDVAHGVVSVEVVESLQ